MAELGRRGLPEICRMERRFGRDGEERFGRARPERFARDSTALAGSDLAWLGAIGPRKGL